MLESIRKKLGQKNKKNKKNSPSARTAALGEASIFPECQDSALGKERLPRVFFLALGKEFF